MDFKTMTIEDIIKWCQENNQVEWLKETAKKKTTCKVYPRKKIEKTTTDKDGNEITKTISVVDKSKPYTEEERPISFVEIKTAFCDKFMPELVHQKKKKATMYELIANL